MGWLLAALLVLLLWLRQPILVLLGSAALFVYSVWDGGNPQYVIYDTWEAFNKEVLLAVPLFMFAGAIMSRGTIARRLIDLAVALTRPMPGGLAIATVLSAAGFAAISGSATVTLLAVGAIMYQALLENGYSKSFAIGLISASGVLGIIIPPSIPLILYGVMTETSIADLFIAGLGPALVLVLILALYTLALQGRRSGSSWDLAEIRAATRRGISAIPLPVVILGGIYAGLFTPTEAAAVSVVLAAFVELIVHRDMGLAELKEVALETSRLMGSLFLVLAFAVSLNIFLTYEQVPQQALAAMEGMIDSQWQFLVLGNLMLLLVGMVIDIGSAVLILGPMLEPMANRLGIDSVQLGIMMIVNLGIGYLTPPMGLNLIVAMGAFKEDFVTVTKAVLPFIGLMLLGLAIIALVPSISLFLVG
ncbi:MAG: TRAP transporter large permease subunit [Pseudomonadota bacterium]